MVSRRETERGSEREIKRRREEEKRLLGDLVMRIRSDEVTGR